jgi:hypothetical protein
MCGIDAFTAPCGRPRAGTDQVCRRSTRPVEDTVANELDGEPVRIIGGSTAIDPELMDGRPRGFDAIAIEAS